MVNDPHNSPTPPKPPNAPHTPATTLQPTGAAAGAEANDSTPPTNAHRQGHTGRYYERGQLPRIVPLREPSAPKATPPQPAAPLTAKTPPSKQPAPPLGRNTPPTADHVRPTTLPPLPKTDFPDKRSPPWVSEPHLPQHQLARQPFRNCPAAHYINKLASKIDRQCVHSRLRRIAVFLSGDQSAQPIDYPWWTVDAHATEQIRYWVRDTSLHYQRNLVSALRGVLRQCLRLGYMKADDFMRATMDLKTPSPSPSPKGRFVPHEDVQALFAAIANAPDEPVSRRDTALFAVAFYQALRHAELRALNLGDVSIERKTISVRGKRRRHDVLPLHPATLLALTRWLRLYDLCADLPAETPLFVSLQTSRWRERLVRVPEYTMLALPHQWADRANIAHFTWHDARRTNASTMLDTERIDPYSARKLLRHSRYASTQVYDHRGNSTLRRDIDKLSYGLPIEEQGARLVAELRAQAAKVALAGKPTTTTDEPAPDPVAVLSQLIDEKFRQLEHQLVSSQPTSDRPGEDAANTTTATPLD